jgi:MtrB/PioB family decaheme-associated outer membrane protein
MTGPSKFTLACVAAAVAALYGTAHADSAVGVDTTLGNALSPSYPWVPMPRDHHADSDDRTPTGLPYGIPFVVPEARAKTAEGWFYSGLVEFGGIGLSGNKNAALFRQYKDLESGPYLTALLVSADQPSTASFVEGVAGSIGYDDQFYGMRFGRYNAWSVSAFYNETPHVYTTTFRSLWDGVGSADLTLRSLTPGGSATAAATQTNIRNALAQTDNSELSVLRRKGGLRFDGTLTPEWKAYASFTAEHREGARPFAAVWGGGGGGGNTELPESVDSSTYDILAGVRYADARQSFNVSAQATLFRNDIDTMTFGNPLTVTLNTIQGIAPNAFTFGRYDLYPDNDYYNLKAEYARNFPEMWNGRFTAVASFSRSEQDDALIAPTPFALTGTTLNGISAANVWNTTAALQRQSADARIDALLVDLGVTANPTPNWTVRGKARYYETDNSTDYLACNPLTSQLGRLTNEGTGAALVNTPAYLAANCNLDAVRALNVVPSAGNINLRNVPYDGSQLNASLGADWRIDAKSSLELAYEWERAEPNYREREETTENRVRAGYVHRGLGDGTLRLFYEYGWKRGSHYEADPYEPFVSGSLGPLPTTGNVASWFHAIDTFRKFDLADRDQHVLNARFNYAFSDQLDAGLSLQWRDADYPDSAYGRNDSMTQGSVNLDVNWQPMPELTLYGFYSWQQAKISQVGIQPNACAIGTTYHFWSNGQVTTTSAPPVAGVTLVTTTAVNASNWTTVCNTPSSSNPLFPTSRTWDVDQDSINQVAGVGASYDFGKALVNLAYTWIDARTEIDYSYNAAALGMTAAQASLAGSGWPDLKFRQQIVEANALVPLTKAAALRFYYRYESGRVSDWHYDGVAENPVPANNAVYLDAGPQSYHVNVFGLFLRLSM